MAVPSPSPKAPLSERIKAAHEQLHLLKTQLNPAINEADLGPEYLGLLQKQVDSSDATTYCARVGTLYRIATLFNHRSDQYIDCLEQRLTDLRAQLAQSVPRTPPRESPSSTIILHSPQSSISISPSDGDVFVLPKSAVQIITSAFGGCTDTNSVNSGSDGIAGNTRDGGQNDDSFQTTHSSPSPSTTMGLATPASSSSSDGFATPASEALLATPRPASPPPALRESCCECGQYIQHVFGQPSAYRLCTECEMGRSMAGCNI
ncbi:hypothetical protein QBC41DRAFT_303395 [Cercophora samala]|uniref:Uncharacterized protein n=1 Tax=Cercophora samala TaxID=330535 RepID=A0AA39ZCJ0_9PEZI|nr:hypothetical protein QBC41DRAFT_303395 [Cercophora samala]